MGPDEPRYAWIARTMAQTGDWVTPRLYGSPWFEKPILYYWRLQLDFVCISLRNGRRGCLLHLLLSPDAGNRWLGVEALRFREILSVESGAPGPSVFLHSVAAIGFSRAATPDMLFRASITLAMASAAVILRYAGALTTEPPKRMAAATDIGAIFAFGAFLGLAVLAKGPAAIILAGGAMAIWALATGRWGAALQLLHPFAIASFCVVALPWYVVCARRNPDFLHIFLFQHNFERYLTPIFQHRQPFWFFIPIMLLAAIPWLAFRDSCCSRWAGALARKIVARLACVLLLVLGFLSDLVFQFLAIETAGLHPASDAGCGIGDGHSSVATDRAKIRDGTDGFLPCWRTHVDRLGIGGSIWMRRLPAGAANPARTPISSAAFLAIVGGDSSSFSRVARSARLSGFLFFWFAQPWKLQGSRFCRDSILTTRRAPWGRCCEATSARSAVYL